MARLIRAAIVLTIIGLLAFVIVTRPRTLGAGELAGFVPSVERGKYIFTASGCASCHAAEGATGEQMLVLAGGKAFPSPYGTFYAPNISPSAQGIGDWSDLDLANALHWGVGKDGTHLFPALPYTSYRKMAFADIKSLFVYLQTLPPSDAANRPHDIGFPFNIRRTLGGWKTLFLKDGFVIEDLPPEAERGRYIVEALAHCGECHTPRNGLGALETSAWLGGALSPDGVSRVPNITPGGLDWSEDELVEYLTSGFTPEFDVAGGLMAEVIANTSQLPPEDLRAIAAYLKAVPSVAD